MQKVADRMQRLIQEYAAVYPDVTPEQAKAIVDDMLAIQHDEVKVRKKHVSKFRKVLPEVKVARFLQLENKLDAVVKVGLADAVPLME
jgi:polyhydroxyalkanoate synthesis regulator phasin